MSAVRQRAAYPASTSEERRDAGRSRTGDDRDGRPRRDDRLDDTDRPRAPTPPGAPRPGDDNRRRPGDNPGSVRGPAPATLLVRLPADATLTIDGSPTRATSGERRFVTPTLQPGKAYYYLLKAEVDRRGQKVQASRNVKIEAVRTAEVTLEFPGVSLASK